MLAWLLKCVHISPKTKIIDSGSVSDANPLSQEDIKGLHRTLRKLELRIEEHVDVLGGFAERVEEVKGISSLKESVWLGVVDRLYQLHEALRSEQHRLACELLVDIVEIEDLVQLTPIAHYEYSIDPTECQAVATVNVDASEHGFVKSIVRQGYRRPNGALVREAVVILGRSNGIARGDVIEAIEDEVKTEEEVSNG